MEFSESLSVFYSLLIKKISKGGSRTAPTKSRLSVLIRHLKRITDRSQKNADNCDESTDNAVKAVRRCIISLNFMPTFDMIISWARRKMYLNN